MDSHKDTSAKEESRKKKRRPRSAAGERNYLCGCSKNKHDGIFPIGSNAKRKIPRNMEENDDSFIINLPKLFEEFEKFLRSLGGALDMSEANALQMKSGEIESSFSNKFPDFNRDIQPFVKAIKKMAEINYSSADFMQFKDNLSIYEVLSFFLMSIRKFCHRDFFREYVALFSMLIRALNEKGQMFLDKDEKLKADSSPEVDSLFCASKKVPISAEILNLFIAELFPKYLRELEKYLGFEDENISNLILMTKFYGNWLYHSEFTSYKLEINVDF